MKEAHVGVELPVASTAEYLWNILHSLLVVIMFPFLDQLPMIIHHYVLLLVHRKLIHQLHQVDYFEHWLRSQNVFVHCQDSAWVESFLIYLKWKGFRGILLLRSSRLLTTRRRRVLSRGGGFALVLPLLLNYSLHVWWQFQEAIVALVAWIACLLLHFYLD